MSSLLENVPENYSAIEQVVRDGGIILYPTETVYGLGCDPFNSEAIDKIRELKGRAKGSPMLAVTPDWTLVLDWFDTVPDTYGTLMKHEPPCPITMIYQASDKAPQGLVSGGTIAVRRVPKDIIAARLAESVGRALLSTSANITGHPPPSKLEDVDPRIVENVDCVVKSTVPLSGVPSTVIRDNKGVLEILRHGCADPEDLQRILIDEYEKADN